MTEEAPKPPQETSSQGAAAPGAGERRRALCAAFWAFVANSLAAWLVGLGYLGQSLPAGEITALGCLHFQAAYLSHFAVLVLVPSLAAFGLTSIWPRRWSACAAFAALMAPFFFLLYVDEVIWANFREHFNMSYYELLVTPGVGDQLHFSARDFLNAFGIVALIAALEAGGVFLFWWLAGRWRWMPGQIALYGSLTVAGLLLVAMSEKCVYAYADATSRRDVLVRTRRLPLYLPLTCKHFLRRRGFEVDKQHRFSTSLALNYPLVPLEPPAGPAKHNVLWIAVESWRADIITPEVSPRLSDFGERCLAGGRHYSTGNCTRFGVFGMFYGLHPFYWKSFLADHREPVLVELLRKMDYQFLMMGSANFRNPEFRRTCFQGLEESQIVDGKQLHPGRSHQRDLAMIERFEELLEKRDQRRPFFCFMFMDSLHSPYRFQELPGFAPPFAGYRDSVRYERLASDERERRQAWARYKNSAAYVDFLIGRALQGLEKRDLLAKTIVMISGDHSQEFGECGQYGHNGNFSDWQVKVPFLFHYPGVRPGRIEKLTSHLDWAPTTLGLLGVKGPPAGYCQGRDLLGEGEHEYVVAGSFNTAGIITREGDRLVFPLESYRVQMVDYFDKDYHPVADRKRMRRLHGLKLFEVKKGSGRFKK